MNTPITLLRARFAAVALLCLAVSGIPASLKAATATAPAAKAVFVSKKTLVANIRFSEDKPFPGQSVQVRARFMYIDRKAGNLKRGLANKPIRLLVDGALIEERRTGDDGWVNFDYSVPEVFSGTGQSSKAVARVEFFGDKDHDACAKEKALFVVNPGVSARKH